MKKICLLCLFFFTFGKIYSFEREKTTGSLIVSYKTDCKGERLDRTRFWLKRDEEAFREFYPKGESFVDKPEDPSRMVVIEALKPGIYTIQFLIPNRDHYFQETPERQVTIIAGEIVKLDQTIRGFSSIPNETVVLQVSEPLQKVEDKNEAFGTLRLYVNVSEAAGEIVNRQTHEQSIPLVIAQKETEISLPAGDYVLLFYEAEEDRKLPHPINFKIESLQIKEVNAYFAPRD